MTMLGKVRPVERRSLETRATDALREAIIGRRYAPGDRLTETQLSELLGISRGTVRSALHKLLAEGLLAQRPYAAWEVVGLTRQDAWELFTLRSALEGLAAELVAEGLGDGRLAAAGIEAAFAALAAACDAGDGAAADEADFAFHKAVVAISGHGRLLTQYERVEAQLRMLIVVANEAPRATTRLVAEHRPLLEVLASGDGARAAAAFRAHARHAGEATLARMRVDAAARDRL
ncbi:MAG TPA: GntR family transcriptional regulator [Roseomonas sp.]|jgi:DNA-binding GntR family transcriptional regulator